MLVKFPTTTREHFVQIKNHMTIFQTILGGTPCRASKCQPVLLMG